MTAGSVCGTMTRWWTEGNDVDKNKRKRLEAAGWRVGSTAEFLGLTPEEMQLIDMKLALGAQLREVRGHRGWSQEVLAKRLGSSQSRVAKMEAGDPSVSLDLLVRALLAMGTSLHQIGQALSAVEQASAV
jgi:ribosome-binding protein aMBF1 (putative translation factor)